MQTRNKLMAGAVLKYVIGAAIYEFASKNGLKFSEETMNAAREDDKLVPPSLASELYMQSAAALKEESFANVLQEYFIALNQEQNDLLRGIGELESGKHVMPNGLPATREILRATAIKELVLEVRGIELPLGTCAAVEFEDEALTAREQLVATFMAVHGPSKAVREEQRTLLLEELETEYTQFIEDVPQALLDSMDKVLKDQIPARTCACGKCF